MLIINADDWGRSRAETDAAAECYRRRIVTSVSAMVLMKESERSASIARTRGIDAGLHLNLTEPFSAPAAVPPCVANSLAIVARFLTSHRYAPHIYHPGLRRHFRDVYMAQHDEYVRLYDRVPLPLDGHEHMHLCMNLLIDPMYVRGQQIRRHLWFWPGEKSGINRMYRRAVNQWLEARYELVDYFVALSHCFNSDRMERVRRLAATSVVEIMAHPGIRNEYAYLTSRAFAGMLLSAGAKARSNVGRLCTWERAARATR